MNALRKVNLFSRHQDPEAYRILLVPGHLFFVESIELPADLSNDEAESLARLTLESMTPFPMEQLLWGFARDTGTGRLLIYAAYQERLRKAGYQHLENYRQVFPDFLALDNASQTDRATHILKGNTGWVAAAFEPHARFPTRIAAREVPVSEGEQEGDEEGVDIDEEALLEDLLADLDEHQYPIDRSLEGPVETHSAESGAIQFVLAEGTATLPEKQVWEADIRDATFSQRIRALRKREQWLWKFMAAAALAALLLVGLDLLRWTGGRIVQNREHSIAARSGAVTQIGDRNDLVNRLELRSSGQLRPFLTLQAMNQTRPRTLYFTDIEAGEANRFTIDGIASNPNEVNEYAQSLRDSGYFESVIQENRRVVSGQVNFTLRLVISELPTTQTAHTLQTLEEAPS